MRDRVLLKGEIMVRFGVAIAALACMAAPLFAQESTEQLKKELEQLRAEVEGLKAVNQSKEVPAATNKVDGDAMAADDNPLMTMFKQTKLSGFVDVGYSFSFNKLHSDRPGVGAALRNAGNPVRAFDNRDHSFYMHEAHLQLERLASKDMIVGYHIELGFGHDPSVYDGNSVTAQEAWVQILAPIGSGLDIRAGKLATLCGYEVLENINNMNYSRGMLFGLVQPFTHTGVRASMGFGGNDNNMITFTLGFNNGLNASGSDRYADQDHGKAVEFQVMVRPTKDVFFALNLHTGNDTSGTNPANVSTNDNFYIFDIVAGFTMDKLTLGLNVDFASAQQQDITPPTTASGRTPLSGIALYAKYGWSDTMGTAVRIEYFSDKEGAFFNPAEGGPGVRVTSFTITQEIKVAQQLIIRLEVRADNSNDHIFLRDEDKGARGDYSFGAEAIMPF
jgi:hypothetical protein